MAFDVFEKLRQLAAELGFSLSRISDVGFRGTLQRDGFPITLTIELHRSFLGKWSDTIDVEVPFAKPLELGLKAEFDYKRNEVVAAGKDEAKVAAIVGPEVRKRLEAPSEGWNFRLSDVGVHGQRKIEGSFNFEEATPALLREGVDDALALAKAASSGR
jgi:hypothetical protein